MATVVDSISIKGLRPVHFDQLRTYLAIRDNDPWYFGNPKQFEKRHAELITWIDEIIDLVDSPDIRIPKRN